MIEVVILTSAEKGSASVHLEAILNSKKIKVNAVVLNQGKVINKKKHYIRKINKVIKIGILGALNGIRMRKWYSENLTQYLTINAIEDICISHNITFKVTPSINSPQTIEYFKNAGADLGLSLGNGYIGNKVFSIPKFGMINVHHEELPAYQNAQSIIWQLYNNSSHTGYTIHKVDKHIDTGEILFREIVPITFKENLEDTVSFNYAQLWKKSAAGLVRVLEDFETYYENSTPQSQGTTYTTPGLKQFMRILRNFNRMK